jgi:hypothetical protein
MKRKKISSKTLKLWAAKYEDWLYSGQTQSEYCDKNSIGLHLFKSRIKDARKKKLISDDVRFVKNKNESKNKFIPLSVTKADKQNDPNPYCEIIFCGTNRIQIDTKDSLIMLQQLLQSNLNSHAL